MGSLGELAEVMLEREAVYMGARALTDTRRERVVVEAIPSGGRVVVEPIPSDDGEEEEAWCDWCCQNCGEAGEDFDEPDACPECGTGDRALKFYPDSLDPPPVLAVSRRRPGVLAAGRLLDRYSSAGGEWPPEPRPVRYGGIRAVVAARSPPAAPTTQATQPNPRPFPCRDDTLYSATRWPRHPSQMKENDDGALPTIQLS